MLIQLFNLYDREDQSYKKSKYLDFMAAQVKTLSFLAYVIKIYQESIEQHSSALVKGMMNLMVSCPPCITNMRKEFFIATRHILSYPEIRPSISLFSGLLQYRLKRFLILIIRAVSSIFLNLFFRLKFVWFHKYYKIALK